MYRQEVFNVLLAQLLQERGTISAPENILQFGDEKERRMPDVIVNFNGLRTVIEGEMGGRTGAHQRALKSAKKRVEEGIAHIGVGIVYPVFESDLVFADLKRRLQAGQFEIAIVTESTETEFVLGGIDYLEMSLRNTFDHLVREDVVQQAAASLDGGIERFAAVVVTKVGAISRLAEALGIRNLPTRPPKENEDSE